MSTVRGFTLIELLGVLVLMGLASALIAGSMTDRSRSPGMVLRRVAAIDAHARQLARAGNPMVMRFAGDHLSVEILESELPLTRHPLGIGCEVRVGSDQVDMIVIDRLGQSVDYTVRAAGRSMTVHGLTGWIDLGPGSLP